MVISPRHHEEMLILVHLAEEKKKKIPGEKPSQATKRGWSMANGEWRAGRGVRRPCVHLFVHK